MTRTLLLFTFLLVHAWAESQNLIPNPGFEDHYEGKTGYANIYACKSWMSANPGTPDYYSPLLPGSFQGKQTARSGEAYAGIIALDKYPDIAEYLQVQLRDSLRKDHIYELRLYAALSPASPFCISNIEACLSPERIRLSTWVKPEVSPQLINPPGNLLCEPERWQMISWTYQAAGGEQFLTLGTFTAERFINRIRINDKDPDDILSYYYIDDVSLTEVKRESPLLQETGTDTTVDKVFVLKNVLFHFDKTTFLESSYPELNKLVGFLRRHPAAEIEILGHTDGKGDDHYNLGLSERRSRAVVDYLVLHGIARKRLGFIGLGRKNAVAGNHTAGGRQKNRRVEFRVTKI